jgi:hypothetical protein
VKKKMEKEMDCMKQWIERLDRKQERNSTICHLTHTKRENRSLVSKEMMDILELELVIGLIREVKKNNKKKRNITFKQSAGR